jgi:hypothetical protein
MPLIWSWVDLRRFACGHFGWPQINFKPNYFETATAAGANNILVV